MHSWRKITHNLRNGVKHTTVKFLGVQGDQQIWKEVVTDDIIDYPSF